MMTQDEDDLNVVVIGDGQNNGPVPLTPQSNFNCPSAGLFPSESCSQFHVCVQSGSSGSTLSNCASGLHFDPVNQICNWPAAAGCEKRASQFDLTYEAARLCQSLPDGLYKDPVDCSGMFWCSRGALYRSQCPYGQLFDEVTGVCTYFATSRCETGIIKLHGSPTFRMYTDDSALVASQIAKSSKSREKNVICYFSNWAHEREGKGRFIPENIQQAKCTHIIYAFATLDPLTLELTPSHRYTDLRSGALGQGFYKRIVYEAHELNAKALLAIGGWTDSSTDKYSRLVKSSKARKNFVNKAVEFLTQYGFDGLSLDWQYPVCWQSDCSKGQSGDRNGFTDLIKDLKTEFQSKNLILAASLSGYKGVAQKAYNIPQLNKYLDIASINAYDYHGYWYGTTGHHSPLNGYAGAKNADFNVVS